MMFNTCNDITSGFLNKSDINFQPKSVAHHKYEKKGYIK